jgi:hypothetical protein
VKGRNSRTKPNLLVLHKVLRQRVTSERNCEVCGGYMDVAENLLFLGCDSVSSGKEIPTFSRKIRPS